MKESLVNILKFNRTHLIEKLCVDGNFWTRLVSNGTLTNEHKELCDAKSTKAEKLELLLDMMERRDDSCFEKFCQALSVNNPEVVRLYLRVAPTQFLTQPETDQFKGLNIEEHLDQLRKENAELQGELESESLKYATLEHTNATMQGDLEKSKHEVRKREVDYQEMEENFVNKGKELEHEKLQSGALKKEKSTDCDSALIPLLCVHG